MIFWTFWTWISMVWSLKVYITNFFYNVFSFHSLLFCLLNCLFCLIGCMWVAGNNEGHKGTQCMTACLHIGAPVETKRIFLCWGLESWGRSMNSRGLSAQPCGAPVLNTRVEQVKLSIQTVCGLFVRKSGIQLQSVVLRPREFNLPVNFWLF